MKIWRDRIAAVIFSTLVVLSAIAVTWTVRQAYVVHKLQRRCRRHLVPGR